MARTYRSDFNERVIPSELKVNNNYRVLLLFFQFTLKYVEEHKDNMEIISIARRLYGGKDDNVYSDLEQLFGYMENAFMLPNKVLTNRVENLVRIIGFLDEDQWMNVIRSSYFMDFNQEANSIVNSAAREASSFPYASCNSIIEAAHNILEVSEYDIYLDLFCGYFLSSFKSKAKKNIGVEINDEIISTSYMLHIMADENFSAERFEIVKDDLYRTDSFITADKVFVDGLSEGPDFRGCNTLVNLFIAIEAVGLGGMGICSVFERDVLSEHRNSERKNIILDESIEAILVTGSRDDKTGFARYLVVINKKKKNDKIFFIDSKNDIAKGSNMLKLIETYKTKKEINGYSRFVSKEEIKNNKCRWNVQDYIRLAQEYRDVDQINSELDEMYNELYSMLKEQNKIK